MRIYIIVSIFLCPFFQRLEHYIQGVRLKLRFVVIYNKKMVVAHHMQSQGMYHYPMGDTCPKRYDCIFWVVFFNSSYWASLRYLCNISLKVKSSRCVFCVDFLYSVAIIPPGTNTQTFSQHYI